LIENQNTTDNTTLAEKTGHNPQLEEKIDAAKSEDSSYSNI
jgi:hypothetical protein